jgi:hypothetical protein
MQVRMGPQKTVTECDSRDKKACYEVAAALREKQIRSKERMRKRLAALSYTEKITILEKLRDREKVIAASCLRRKPSKKQSTDEEM